jgi:hypothetical protein
MPRPYRLLGLGNAQIDLPNREVHFEFTATDKRIVKFVAEYGALAQITGALGKLFSEFRRVLAPSGTMTPIAAEEVATSHVQKDQWANAVLMQLTTPLGVPYTFSLSPQGAAHIAEQLKTESAKPYQAGTA